MPISYLPRGAQGGDSLTDGIFAGTKWSSIGDGSNMPGRSATPYNPYGSPAGATTNGPTNGTGNGGGSARVNAARDSMYGLASGRLKDQQNDPVDALIRSQLQDRVNGKGLPYDQATKDALFSQQAQMAAAAMKANQGAVRGNPNDPAYQARMDELNAGRQGQVMQGRLDVDTKANLANDAARMQAISGLNSFNNARQNRLTGSSNYLSSLYEQETANDDGQGGAAGAPRNNVQIIGGGGGGNRAPASTSLADDPFFAPSGPAHQTVTYGAPRSSQSQTVPRPTSGGNPKQPPASSANAFPGYDDFTSFLSSLSGIAKR